MKQALVGSEGLAGQGGDCSDEDDSDDASEWWPHHEERQHESPSAKVTATGRS